MTTKPAQIAAIVTSTCSAPCGYRDSTQNLGQVTASNGLHAWVKPTTIKMEYPSVPASQCLFHVTLEAATLATFETFYNNFLKIPNTYDAATASTGYPYHIEIHEGPVENDGMSWRCTFLLAGYWMVT